jgi:excisionase family DNA binding protein
VDAVVRYRCGMSTDKMLGPKDAAALLGISTDTLIRWGDQGRVRYTRLPSGYRRYRREDLEGLLTVVNDPDDTDLKKKQPEQQEEETDA